MAWNENASAAWNSRVFLDAVSPSIGSITITTGISYSTLATDEIILVSGAIAPIFINLLASGMPAGKLYTVKDAGTATAGTNGIVISGLGASINGVASGMSMTSGFQIGPTAAAAKTYNKTTFIYDGVGNFWSIS